MLEEEVVEEEERLQFFSFASSTSICSCRHSLLQNGVFPLQYSNKTFNSQIKTSKSEQNDHKSVRSKHNSTPKSLSITQTNLNLKNTTQIRSKHNSTLIKPQIINNQTENSQLKLKITTNSLRLWKLNRPVHEDIGVASERFPAKRT